MAQQDDAGPGRAGGIGQQGMAGAASGGGKAGARLGAVPIQALPVGPLSQGRVAGEGGPADAVGVQAVVDGQGQDAATMSLRPGGCQFQQGERVAAARKAQDDRRIDMNIEPGTQAIKNAGVGYGSVVRRDQAQSASERMRAATLRRSAEARAL